MTLHQTALDTFGWNGGKMHWQTATTRSRLPLGIFQFTALAPRPHTHTHTPPPPSSTWADGCGERGHEHCSEEASPTTNVRELTWTWLNFNQIHTHNTHAQHNAATACNGNKYENANRNRISDRKRCHLLADFWVTQFRINARIAAATAHRVPLHPIFCVAICPCK